MCFNQRSDLKLFINILIEEDITTLEDAVDLLSNIEGYLFLLEFTFTFCFALSGDILDHMGQNARLFANNLTLKGKRLLKQWPVLLKDLPKTLTNALTYQNPSTLNPS